MNEHKESPIKIAESPEGLSFTIKNLKGEPITYSPEELSAIGSGDPEQGKTIIAENLANTRFWREQRRKPL